MKICNQCLLETENFPLKGGKCKLCININAKKFREARIERLKEQGKPEFIICSKCNEQKSEFRLGRTECLDCERKRGREYRQKTDKSKIWVENNREKMSELQHNSYIKNKEKINIIYNERYNNDKLFNLSKNHRTIIRRIIKNDRKTTPWEECNKEKFLNWIKFQFDNNMTLENYNIYWVVDHVLPINLFLNSEISENIIFSWLNIKPVLKKYNLIKNKHIDKVQIQEHLNNIENFCQENINENYVKTLKAYL